MVNESKRYKTITAEEMAEIENLNKLLHQKAANPPKYNPFTVNGNQAWAEWSEGCREIERQLEAAGVAL